MYLQIPIEVQGNQEGGGQFRERTHTVIVNRDGARISLCHLLQPGENITITNLRTNVSCPFRVVERTGRSIGEDPEWGVECLNPEANFWDIYFPSGEQARVPGEHVDALLECAVCGARELAKLPLNDYRERSLAGTLPRNCRKCRTETEWRFGYVEALTIGRLPWEGEPTPDESLGASAGSEKRTAKRLAVKLPVRIRLPNGLEEVARTENLSRMGVCFISDLEMQPDDIIQLTIGYVLGGRQGEIPARVVWRRALEGTNRFLYGVHLETQTGR